MITKTVTFPCWPVWNFHFAERDVAAITAVRYFDEQNQAQTYPLEKIRRTCGHNGVSGITFKEKHNLPATRARADAVAIDYEFEDLEP